ncbi:hypothetical protein ARMSODRAFT_982415 [Armillaria solidipes]|uniref:Uncharacterized protein n=1 Tax=Armillaria solidipes TaxID=1076256 RepID=A0A2H3B6V6_9AGAR|nr:hypothetical protein ARMSODRAFT_982415 [Armillaria solidipes]
MTMSTSSSNAMSKQARSNTISDSKVDPNNTPFCYSILGLQLKGDVANSFAKAHTLRGPPLMQSLLTYLAYNNDGNSEDTQDAAVEEPSGGDVPSMPEASSQPVDGGVVHLNTEQSKLKVKWHATAYQHFKADIEVIWNEKMLQWAQEFTCSHTGT